MNIYIRKRLLSPYTLALGVALLCSPAVLHAQEPAGSPVDTVRMVMPDSTGDTTGVTLPDAVRDSIIESTRDDVAAILKLMHGEEADTADTAIAQQQAVLPPVFVPGAGFAGRSRSFDELTALPHVSFSDHLLPWPEFDAFPATEYGTERRFLHHGLSPLPVDVSVDDVSIDLRRPTFPQTMAPDLMVIPPYLLASLSATPAGTGGRPGRSFAIETNDSLVALPYSDFFVRRGDYGLSLTQGRLFRPLPGGRLVNLGFCFAQSAGRGWYDAANNRYLQAKFITPLKHGYNLAVNGFQYLNKSDIQTPEEFQRYQLQRDDLNWRIDALVYRGGATSSPWSARLLYDDNKYFIKSNASTTLETQWGIYSRKVKISRAALDVRYLPVQADSLGGIQTGATLALQQMSIDADDFRYPDYVLWFDRYFRLSAAHTAYVAASLGGTDEDTPAPNISGGWRLSPAANFALELGLNRSRIIPEFSDRKWPLYTAVFEDIDDRVYTYAEAGNEELTSWWSNNATAELNYRPGKRLALGLSGWASYEQDYYYWHDSAPDDTDLFYQPVVTDARTVGSSLHLSLLGPGPLNTGVTYSFKRAEKLTGERLPEYVDHKLSALTDAEIFIRKYNLELHGTVEFMYWRAPSPEYTSYDTRNVFRADVLGSATIKDFTVYWLAQNVFNYGYRRAPGYNYLGRTIMWGLHLRFYN